MGRVVLMMLCIFQSHNATAENRPWGNLKSVEPAQPATNPNSGYQGKYNPWQKLVPEQNSKENPSETSVWGQDGANSRKKYEYSTRENQKAKGRVHNPREIERYDSVPYQSRQREVERYDAIPYQPLPLSPLYDPYYGYDGYDSGGYGQRYDNYRYPFSTDMWPGTWSFR